jgi:hypothetical protein
MKNCYNHPNEKALSVCHSCGKDYCAECLSEGKEYYYCKNPECQKILNKELQQDKLPANVICPNCESAIELSEEERISGKAHCTECEALIDFNFGPPKILDKEKYVELLSSLNQGDIGLIKSILEDSNIDYYVFGENFLSVDPLIQPARFYVNEEQAEEAKELLKDFELRIWGTSKNQYE